MTPKQRRFIDAYMEHFNAAKAYRDAGYSGNGARQSAYRLLQNKEIKAEVARRMAEGRMSPEEITQRLELMATGEIPTKVIERPSQTYGRPTQHKEYDTRGALQDLGKIYALFVDKQIVENIGLEIVDDSEAEADREG